MQKIDESKLTKEQQQVLKVFKGELDKGEVKKIDLNDLYILDQGTRHAGARKILIKHYGAPNKRLNNTEINHLAAFSNQGRFNSESDHAKSGFKPL